MARNKKLVKQISAVIKPWAESAEAPPFSERQLLIMALASSPRPMTEEAAYEWILDHFKYYKKAMFAELWQSQTGDLPCDSYAGSPSAYDRSENIPSFIEEFLSCFYMVDLPLIEIAYPNEVRFMVSSAGAHASLSDLLNDGPDDASPFRFFELPPELRNRIYEMFFRYPASGLCYDGPGRRFEMLTRSLNDMADDIDCWDASEAAPFFTPAPRDILMPLSIDRQFYSEAMPIFYRINHFHFDGYRSLWDSLSALNESRRRHIRYISVCDSRCGASVYFPGAVKSLLQPENLRVLNLQFDEEAWLVRSKGGKIKKYDSIMKHPGVAQLRKMRGLSQVFLRGCPRLEAEIKADMLSPKPDLPLVKARPSKRATQGGAAATEEKHERRKAA
ncbi:hypothetical protein LTR53_008820 [Teratosphaeriaceae sp. CCFEE 6253]|nr:hypothetical protein LTR53_008820 [Teratosphaeriaceae sp. CCFEE 6253]